MLVCGCERAHLKFDKAPHQGTPENGGRASYYMMVSDAFAASAINGILTSGSGSSPEDLAIRAYDIAEAMMAERIKRSE
jgi:hypothetical protein